MHRVYERLVTTKQRGTLDRHSREVKQIESSPSPPMGADSVAHSSSVTNAYAR